MQEVSPDQSKQAVEDMHCGTATLVESVAVKETFEGRSVWERVVHVFDLDGHPGAMRAYAWSSPVEADTKRRFFAVLHLGFIRSPQDAVRSAIVAEHQSERRKSIRTFPHFRLLLKKRWGVREYPDWRRQADKYEVELRRRKIPFQTIKWDRDSASASN